MKRQQSYGGNTTEKYSRLSNCNNDRTFSPKENTNLSAATLSNASFYPVNDDAEGWKKKYNNLQSRFDQLEKDLDESNKARKNLRKMCEENQSCIIKLKKENQILKLESSTKFVENKNGELQKYTGNHVKDASFETPKGSRMKIENKRQDPKFEKKPFYESKVSQSFNSSNTIDLGWCQNMINSSQFWKDYVKKFFNIAERLLPQTHLEKKMKQSEEVIKQLQKSGNDKANELHLSDLEKALKSVRDSERKRQYGICDEDLSVGITADGSKFYYSLKSGKALNKNMIWHPYSDKDCLVKLNFKEKYLSKFAIPIEYNSCEYILIIQNSKQYQNKISKLFPEDGRLEDVSSRQTRK